jgi:hypothetical protein
MLVACRVFWGVVLDVGAEVVLLAQKMHRFVGLGLRIR